MKTNAVKAAAVFAAGMALSAGPAQATNGYFTHGVGTQSKGMAGTGVGSNADMGAIMTASNPALGVFVGDRWEIGLSIFSPRRSYEASAASSNGGLIDLGGGVLLPTHSIAAGEVNSSSEYFPIPYVAKNWSLANDGNITAAFYGRGGMNTDWDDPNASATSLFCWNPDRDGLPQRPVTGPGPYCAGDAGRDSARRGAGPSRPAAPVPSRSSAASPLRGRWSGFRGKRCADFRTGHEDHRNDRRPDRRIQPQQQGSRHVVRLRLRRGFVVGHFG